MDTSPRTKGLKEGFGKKKKRSDCNSCQGKKKREEAVAQGSKEDEYSKGEISDREDMENEDDTNMAFDRSQGWKVDNANIKVDLERALEMAGVSYKRKDEFGNEVPNMSTVEDALSNHGLSNMSDRDFPSAKRAGFMSKPTFNQWWKGVYHKKIDKTNFAIVMSFMAPHEFEREHSA